MLDYQSIYVYYLVFMASVYFTFYLYMTGLRTF